MPVKLGVPFSANIGFGAASSVAFSPDDKTLASFDFDAFALWNVSDPKSPIQLGTTLRNLVWSVAFSPDGKILASGNCGKLAKNFDCIQGEIILWDVSNPKTPVVLGVPLYGHTSEVWSVAFSPDGKTLASGSADKTIILWDVDPDSWRTRACQIAHRNLTQAEWAQYLGGQPYHQTCPQWPAGE